ncbi:MAG: ADOP family duplicated permease [Terriglobales bacterium]
MRQRKELAWLVVLNLGLGLGATIVIFSVADAFLLRPLPYPAPQQLVTPLHGVFPKGYYVALERRVQAMELAAVSPGTALNLQLQGQEFSLHGARVSTNFFQVLGAAASLGTGFKPHQDQPGQDGEVVLSAAAWRQYFGGRSGIVGQEIALGGRERRVAGVMPASFRFPSDATQFWVPLTLDPDNAQDFWATYAFEAVGRLRPGTGLAAARADFKRAAAQAVGEFPYPVASNYATLYRLVRLRRALFGDLQPTLLLILGAAGLVLLIACANAANLLLTQFGRLRSETAIRLALGAGRARMLRWFLWRSVGLALAGGGSGLLLADWALPVVVRWLPSEATAPLAVGMDWRVVAFAVAASVMSGIVTGLAPAWRSTRANLAQDLRGGAVAPEAPGRVPLASLLLIGEIGLAVVVVVAAALVARSLETLTRQDPGFRDDATLTMRIHPTEAYCRLAQRCATFYQQAQSRLLALPGVQAVALVNAVPLGGLAPIAPVIFENHPLLPGKQIPLVWASVVSPGYLRATGTALLGGRTFTAADGAASMPVAMISQSLARSLWPGQSPLGKQVATVSSGLVAWTIVGEVGDVREFALQGDPGFYQGEVYFSLAQALAKPPLAGSLADMTVVLRSPAPPSAARLRQTLVELNSEVAVDPPRTLAELVYASVAGPRITTRLLLLFALLALAMGMLGVYAVMGEVVGQREREYGLRMALGAQAGSVRLLVLRRALLLAACGVGAGLVAAWALSRLLAGLLFHVSAVDPAIYAAAAGVVIAAALAACWWPARRATRVDPVVVLRGE